MLDSECRKLQFGFPETDSESRIKCKFLIWATLVGQWGNERRRKRKLIMFPLARKLLLQLEFKLTRNSRELWGTCTWELHRVRGKAAGIFIHQLLSVTCWELFQGYVNSQNFWPSLLAGKEMQVLVVGNDPTCRNSQRWDHMVWQQELELEIRLLNGEDMLGHEKKDIYLHQVM